MNKFIFSLLLLTGLQLCAQNSNIQLGEQAVFTDCVKEISPYKCTLEKFESDITALITPQFTAELKDRLLIDYFSLSIILLTDENGKVVQEETDILCHYDPLKNEIRRYLHNLPALYPKDSKMKDRRSVFIINYVFLYSTTKNCYINAPQSVISTSHIKQEMLTMDSYPAYENCKHEGVENEVCFHKTFSKLLTKKMRYPHSNEKNKIIRLILDLSFSRTGEITLEYVEGDEDNYFHNELTRLIKKLPRPEPASVRGLPVAARYKLPLTIRLNNDKKL
ncbi:hypothetical protein [Flavobacterium psychrotrophum]|uniref:hypothetical protein n=1 Tax=Flavobacterium psychrotrophum TaxID=2294119 RepID=UPI000E32307B|nr:hypothetical protein [Flavobacterium psychrotrophum]